MPTIDLPSGSEAGSIRAERIAHHFGVSVDDLAAEWKLAQSSDHPDVACLTATLVDHLTKPEAEALLNAIPLLPEERIRVGTIVKTDSTEGIVVAIADGLFHIVPTWGAATYEADEIEVIR